MFYSTRRRDIKHEYFASKTQVNRLTVTHWTRGAHWQQLNGCSKLFTIKCIAWLKRDKHVEEHTADSFGKLTMKFQQCTYNKHTVLHSVDLCI